MVYVWSEQRSLINHSLPSQNEQRQKRKDEASNGTPHQLEYFVHVERDQECRWQPVGTEGVCAAHKDRRRLSYFPIRLLYPHSQTQNLQPNLAATQPMKKRSAASRECTEQMQISHPSCTLFIHAHSVAFFHQFDFCVLQCAFRPCTGEVAEASDMLVLSPLDSEAR